MGVMKMVEQRMVLERLHETEKRILEKLHDLSTNPRNIGKIVEDIRRALVEQGIRCQAIAFFWEDNVLKRMVGSPITVVGIQPATINHASEELRALGQPNRLIDIFHQVKAISLWLNSPREKEDQDKFAFICDEFKPIANSDIIKRIIFKAYGVSAGGDVFYSPSYLGDRVFFDAIFAFANLLEGWEKLYVERLLHTIVSYIHVAVKNFAFRQISLRSAIASIMSRNMSHNIGSHVLARIVMGGIDGWTQGLGVEEIVDKLTIHCLIRQIDEVLQSSGQSNDNQQLSELCEQLQQRLQNYHGSPDPERARPYVTPEQARSLAAWGKDIQFLARYLQQRMDFIAQVSTEWPTWSEPTWFMRDMMRWFLSQKHLLDYIGRSDGLKAHLYEQPSASGSSLCDSTNPSAQQSSGSGNATDEQTGQTSGAAGATQQEEKLGDIRLHVFMVPEECWDMPCTNSQPNSVEARRKQLADHCHGCDKAEQLGCRQHRNGDTSRDCHRILLYTPGDGSAQCCLDEDFLIVIPGGMVGQHAFFTILENIIRNAAKHGYARPKDRVDHLDVVIEVLYDPEEKVAIRNEVGDQEKRIPARLLRIYTNVSPVDGDNAVVSLENINNILGTGIIKETGEMEKEKWGHAEMKIAAGYLQRRDILHIGGTGQEITGESGKTMLALGQEERGSRAIIRAVKSPIGTLGYEFYIPRPRAVGIVCPEGGAS